MNEKVREVMARAYCCPTGCQNEAAFGDPFKCGIWKGELEATKAALSALSAAGYVVAEADLLLKCKDALVEDGTNEAYHLLRLAADPDLKAWDKHQNHWHEWENATASQEQGE